LFMRRFATHRQSRSFSLFGIAALLLLWSCLIAPPAGAASAPQGGGAQQAFKFGQGGTPVGAGPRLGAFLKNLRPGDIFPGADRIGPPEGKPAVARAYTGDRMVGYVYLTTDIVNTRGYSSKPIDIVVGLSLDGQIVGAKLVEHHEPIVLIGIPEAKVQAFIDGYIGKNYVQEPPRPGAPPPVDIISGATVTLMVVGDSLTRSVLSVARHYGIGREGQAQAATAEHRVVDMAQESTESWDALLKSGAVGHLRPSVAAGHKAFVATGRQGAIDHPEPGAPEDTFIDLYAALVSVPSIGRSLLGDAEYGYLRDRLAPGQQAILIAGNGYSFKGSGYVRGGVFDRIEVIQNENSFRFTDLDHQRLADLMAAGAPGFREVALFTVPTDAVFDPVEPWRLQLTVQRVISVKEKAFTAFVLNYDLPRTYTKVDTQAAQAGTQSGDGTAGTPPVADSQIADADGDEAAPALWKQIWIAKTVQFAIISIALLTLIAVFFYQNQIVKHEVFYKRFRTVFLLFTLFWIGWYAQAQLSVVNVLTFTTSLRTDFSWE